MKEHVQRIRNIPENIKKEHRYYRGGQYGKSIRLPSGTSRSTKQGPLFQPDTREFPGIRESAENIQAFIESKGITKLNVRGKVIC
jgi:hypothetical protein